MLAHRPYSSFARCDDGLPPAYRLLLAIYRRALADLRHPHPQRRYDAQRFVVEFQANLLHSADEDETIEA